MSPNLKGVQQLSLGKNVQIDDSAYISGDKVVIEDDVVIGKNVRIVSKNIFIGKNSILSDGNEIEISDSFSLGKHSILGKHNTFHCRKFAAGDFLYMGKQNEIGGGGSYSINSELKLGKYCMIVDRVVLNTSDKITIGDDVGIGTEVMIWTHGSYNAILDGFPAQFAPVSIGSHVWIPARIIVLPGITIGDNIVIGINSLVNKNLPSGCMAAGIPAKILKENYYPQHLTDDKKDEIALSLLNEYKAQFHDKNIQPIITYQSGIFNILSPEKEESFLNIYTMQWGGVENDYFEDLRDFLRRKGIKFFTDKRFKSIIPETFAQLKNY